MWLSRLFKKEEVTGYKPVICPKCIEKMKIETKGKTDIWVCPYCNLYWIGQRELDEIMSSVTLKFERDPLINHKIEEPIN